MNKVAFQRDWDFYVSNSDRFNFCGCIVPEIPVDLDGVSAKKAFFIFDSQGILIPCCEPELFRKVLICKKSVNFNIKQWIHGYDDAMMGIPEILETFIEPPRWVEKALVKSLVKKCKQAL